MGLIVKEQSENTERILCPAGNHLGICYQVIDLGTKDYDYKGQKKHMHKVKLTWELCDMIKNVEEEIPFSISKNYTLSLYSTAHLRLDLESWRGKGFTEKELQGFDLKNILGIPCLLNVLHQFSVEGKEYAFVATVTPIISTIQVPERFHNSVFLSFEDSPYNMEIFKSLPQYLQKFIQESDEWKAMNGNNDENIEEETIQDNNKFDAGEESIKEDKEINEEKTTAEYSIEELQNKIRKLVGIKYGQEHQSIAVKQWLGAMSIQGCKDRKKLEEFLVHLETMKDIKKEENIPF